MSDMDCRAGGTNEDETRGGPGQNAAARIVTAIVAAAILVLLLVLLDVFATVCK